MNFKPQTLNTPYAFGMQMPLRSYTGESYRFGFNGMENANDIAPGNYTTPFREIDTRLGGRWWSTDPIVKPWESPYAGFSNNPIYYADPSGLDPEEGDKRGKGGERRGRENQCPNCGFGSNRKPIEIGEVEVAGQKDKPTPQPSLPSFPSDNTRVDSSGGFTYNNGSSGTREVNKLLRTLQRIFQPGQPQSMVKNFGFSYDWNGKENLPGNMSHLESYGLNSEEKDITVLMLIAEFMQPSGGGKFLDYFLSKGGTNADLIIANKIIERTFGGSLTISSEVQRTQLKIANEKDNKKMAEIQQNAAMKKEIVIDTFNYGSWQPYGSKIWYDMDTIIEMDKKGNIIKKTGVLTPKN